MKKCARCKGNTDLARYSICRRCRAEVRKAQRAKNPKPSRAANRKSYQKHKEKRLAEKKAYYQANKKRIIASAKKWNKEHPAKRSKIMVFQNAKRRSRIKGAEGNGFSKADWNAIVAITGDICVYCNKAKATSIDHFVPLSRGGANDKSNILPACKRCNSAKNNHMPEQWIAENCKDGTADRIQMFREIINHR